MVWVVASGWIVAGVTLGLLFLERLSHSRTKQKLDDTKQELSSVRTQYASALRRLARRDDVIRKSEAQALMWRNRFNSAIRAMDAGDLDAVRSTLRELAVGGLERRLQIIAEGRDRDPTVPDRPAAKAKAGDV